jgi:glutamyl-tRNA synthetase
MVQTPADRTRFESEGRKAVVRLLMPRQGVCRFHDHIRGDMAVEWTHEADHVIQRADGSCLYNLANVVDDHDMHITHVIRAEEHLSNTPRQIFIAQGLGYNLPEYAHVPFVAEPGSKNKLSKRKLAQYLKNPDFRQVYEHGRTIAAAIGLTASADTFNPVIVDFYRQVGYLPDAIVNYLLLLGWSLDDKTEFFTRDEMIRHFSLERVTKSAASFDAKKLRAFQEHYMSLESLERKTEMALPFLQKAKLIPEPTPTDVVERVTAIVRAAGERIKVAGDILDFDAFFVPDERLAYDEKAFNQYIRKPSANTLLRKIRQRLETATVEAKALETLIQEFAQAEGVRLNDINQPLRVAVTGKAIGFSAYETLALLGRERCLPRIDRALARSESSLPQEKRQG